MTAGKLRDRNTGKWLSDEEAFTAATDAYFKAWPEHKTILTLVRSGGADIVVMQNEQLEPVAVWLLHYYVGAVISGKRLQEQNLTPEQRENVKQKLAKAGGKV